MGLISNFEEFDLWNIDAWNKHADVVARTGWASPSALVRKLYFLSTELGDGFMGNINLDQKRVLTVGSSGDQVFDYALMGSRDITVMDANIATPFFIELKCAALKALSRQEFLDFFVMNFDETNDKFMSLDIYNKLIRPQISNEKVRQYWDYVLVQDKVYVNNQFHFDKGSGLGYPRYLSSDEAYEKTREIIDSVKVNFYFADISEFYNHADGEYDLIDLSNILRYFSSPAKVLTCWEAVDNLHSHLTSNGILKLEYGNKGEKQYRFMDKHTREISYANPEYVVVVWDNDVHRYQARKALYEIEKLVKDSRSSKGGK